MNLTSVRRGGRRDITTGEKDDLFNIGLQELIQNFQHTLYTLYTRC